MGLGRDGWFVGCDYRDAATDHRGQIVGRDWPAAIDQHNNLDLRDDVVYRSTNYFGLRREWGRWL